ncbi:carbamoyl transferase [Candidatus Nitrosopelagicus sp.]|nr:carbamoyl transferase [Candidatus Nitrosopelagicus sp.]
MKVLAVTLERCSGCALFIDDKIVFSSSEERYTKKKSDSLFPENSIKHALEYCNVNPDELDHVLICGNKLSLIPSIMREYSTFTVDDQLRAMKEYWYPKLIENKDISFVELFKNKINLEHYPFNTEWGGKFDYFSLENPYSIDDEKKVSEFFITTISSFLNIEKSKISHVEHDTCHASYALYGSPIRERNTLVVTADAWGDDLSATISIFDGEKINRVKEYNHKDFQLARIYRYTTLVLRMLANEHEYKVMGLAPYHNSKKTIEVEEVLNNIQSIDGIEFSFNSDVKDIFYYLDENLKKFRFDQIASGLQSFTEKLLTKWFSNMSMKFNSSSIVYSGGISMNVKANLVISKIPQIEKFFVCGAGTDETLPIGACYHQAVLSQISPKPLNDLYLGDNASYTENELTQMENIKSTNFDSTDQILDHLLENKIIGICRGRMEMGQRALGNRSIICDPRNIRNVEKINDSIKNRDFWMPFAPIILDEYQDILIDNPKKIESPHMTIAFETKNGKELIPASVHRSDGTARAQLLKKSVNPELWNLIYSFYEKTGIPAILNTSLNLHGYPIVRTIADAMHVFQNSKLDLLWLENHIIEKN